MAKEEAKKASEEKQLPVKIAAISTKTIGYPAKEIRKLVEDNTEVHFLARIGGVAVEYFSGVSKHGEWFGFKGAFTLVNRDGRAFSSSVVYLPQNVTKKLYEQLAKDGLAEMEFLLDVSATSSDKNASGYAFNVERSPSEEALRKADSISARVLSSMNNVKLLSASAKKSG